MTTAVKFEDQERLSEMTVPRNLKVLTQAVLMYRGVGSDFSFQKSMIISFVFVVFSSRLLEAH